jgi:hypothetical protein
MKNVFTNRPIRVCFGISVNRCSGRVARWFIFKPKFLIWVIFGVPLIGKCRYIYNRHSGYCMVIWYIFPVLVSCTKKNLATLVARIDSKCSIVPTSTLFDRSRQQFTSSYVCYNPICSKRQNETCLQFLSSNKMSD